MFTLTLTPKQAAALVAERLDDPWAAPSLILGPPGVGKSAIIQQAATTWVAQQYGGAIPPGAVPIVDVRAGDYDAVDFTGVPYVDARPDGARVLRVTDYAQPIMLPTEGTHGTFGVLFLDELTGATLPVQQVLYRLLLDRGLNGYRLPDGWRVVGAGNRKEDKAAAREVSSALTNRCWVAEVEVDAPGWVEWAINSEIHPAITAYIHAFPQSLHVFDPKSKDPRFASPRSWHKLARDLDNAERQSVQVLGKLSGEAAHLRQARIAGHLGDALAPTVAAYLALFGEIPSLSSVWADPTGVILPRDQSLVVALTIQAARACKREHADALGQFLARKDIAPDIAAMTLTRLQQRARHDPEAGAVVTSRYIAHLINLRNLAV